MFYDRNAEALPLINESSPEDSSVVVPLTFEITDSYGEKHIAQAPFGPLALTKTPNVTSLASLYCSTYATAVPSGEAATQFSSLNKIEEGTTLEEAVIKVFPRVTKLSVEDHCGNWVLHCKVDEVPIRIPVNFVSSGIHKLVSLLAGIATQKNGVVLIDEVDNGFYYKILPDLWSVLHSFAQKYNTQLIVSTHSRECLNALLPTLKRRPSDFKLVRVEMRAKQHVAKVFGGKDLEAAIETDTEVR